MRIRIIKRLGKWGRSVNSKEKLNRSDVGFVVCCCGRGSCSSRSGQPKQRKQSVCG